MARVAEAALILILTAAAEAQTRSVTGAYEGWFRNSDGTATLLVGYFNRNPAQALDIPVGDANRIEPGGPDRGQPTHFHPGRQWGVFTIRVPKEFDGKLTWTLTVNGQTTQIPLRLDPLWLVEPYRDATDNQPPWIAFDAANAPQQGPPLQVARMLRAKAGDAVPLTAWVADDAKVGLGAAAPPPGPPARVTWIWLRGPAPVEFANDRPETRRAPWPQAPAQTKFTGQAATTATFRAPGEYWLAAVVNDWTGTGGNGFQCCWTTAHVRVVVD